MFSADCREETPSTSWGALMRPDGACVRTGQDTRGLFLPPCSHPGILWPPGGGQYTADKMPGPCGFHGLVGGWAVQKTWYYNAERCQLWNSAEWGGGEQLWFWGHSLWVEESKVVSEEVVLELRLVSEEEPDMKGRGMNLLGRGTACAKALRSWCSGMLRSRPCLSRASHAGSGSGSEAALQASGVGPVSPFQAETKCSGFCFSF